MKSESARIQGTEAWGKRGVTVRIMGELPATLYDGNFYDQSSAAIIPKSDRDAASIWVFCKSPDFRQAVRTVDQKLNVTNATLAKVPFDRARWQKVAAEEYPDGLPEPESDDPTQWLFHGRPEASSAPLQVAVARLLGYRWPAELDDTMRLSQRARDLVKRCDELLQYADHDGIVCIPAVRGEAPAAERLFRLLAACHVEPQGDLDDWLRNEFFAEHCKLFHERPFVWHIWDGRKRDGFHALVNYHKLCGASISRNALASGSSRGDQPGASAPRLMGGATISRNALASGSPGGDEPGASAPRLISDSSSGRRLLESLTYAYLGDWTTRQKDGVKRGEGGAEERLAAALELQKRLEAILAGEPPFDLFVRWKPLAEHPIGWEPDINDGVRMNIRPFLASDLPGGKKGAGILRAKPNIKWTRDRGKEPKRPIREFPWFWSWDGTLDYAGGPLAEFTGERHNECHYTNEAKQAAREAAREGKS
ncbi:MAG: BREX-1 system adenine-specific DNA-methyltransferase PglX [Pirellulaceae bacterium]|nr:BREX-1 system adenine-specific DNA-methyltransferase PglX [Pirellulaceae bacterium]